MTTREEFMKQAEKLYELAYADGYRRRGEVEAEVRRKELEEEKEEYTKPFSIKNLYNPSVEYMSDFVKSLNDEMYEMLNGKKYINDSEVNNMCMNLHKQSRYLYLMLVHKFYENNGLWSNGKISDKEIDNYVNSMHNSFVKSRKTYFPSSKLDYVKNAYYINDLTYKVLNFYRKDNKKMDVYAINNAYEYSVAAWSYMTNAKNKGENDE